MTTEADETLGVTDNARTSMAIASYIY